MQPAPLPAPVSSVHMLQEATVNRPVCRLSWWSRTARTAWLVACLSAAAAVGCSDDPDSSGKTGNSKCSYTSTGGLGIDRLGEISLQDNGGKELKSGNTVQVLATGLATGESIDTAVVLSNSAQLAAAFELQVKSAKLTYSEPAGGDDGSEPAFACWAAGSDGKAILDKDGKPTACADYDFGAIVPAGYDENCASAKPSTSARFLVRLTKPKDSQTRSATLTLVIQRDGAGKANETITLPFEAKGGKPRINLTPGTVDFGTVPVGATESAPLQIVNLGDDNLIVTSLEIGIGTPGDFTATVAGETISGGKSVTLKEPLVVAPQKAVPIPIFWTPKTDGGLNGEIVVVSNDTVTPRAKAKLTGNLNVPCLTVSPDKVLDVGVIYVGTTGSKPVSLKSCGQTPAQIWDIELVDDVNGVFELDTAALGATLPTEANPLGIATNKTTKLPVKCTPPSDNGGVPYAGKLRFKDNTTIGQREIELKCFGNAASCPTPYIELPDGEEVLPQSSVTLDGSNSFAKQGSVTEWTWELVSVPDGAVGVGFYPSNKVAKPQLGVQTKGEFGTSVSLNVAGEYCVKLTVKDSGGTASCVAATACILVVPDAGIHVELTWATPGDPDPTDSGEGAGADMDLHFAHDNATQAKLCQNPPEMCNGKPCVCSPDLDKDGVADPWFHSPYDAFWFNKSPDWGQIKVGEDNASLDLDDTDGFGPENLNIQVPESTNYWVGAHYWDDYGFGESVVTTRIYILGVLKGTYVQEMQPCDFWWVKKIEWPSGDLVDVPTANLPPPSAGKVMPKYKSALAASLNGKCKF